MSYNTREATLLCVASLLAARDTEVIVIDNASRDGTPGAIAARYREVTVIEQPENVGFARACNEAVKHARGRFLGFFNSDCIIEPGCLETLIDFLDTHDDASVAVPRLLSADETVQANVAELPSLRSVVLEYLVGHVGDPYGVATVTQPRQVEACSGAALMIRTSAFLAVGGFCERYFMYVEDVELCRRLGLEGRSIYYLPTAVAYHTEGLSSHERSEWLTCMLVRNRQDYLWRALPCTKAALAVLAVRVGVVIAPWRTRMVGRVRKVLRGRSSAGVQSEG